eukprot:1148686-Pelagomonas_calceolata.AAC.6
MKLQQPGPGAYEHPSSLGKQACGLGNSVWALNEGGLLKDAFLCGCKRECVGVGWCGWGFVGEVGGVRRRARMGCNKAVAGCLLPFTVFGCCQLLSSREKLPAYSMGSGGRFSHFKAEMKTQYLTPSALDYKCVCSPH